VTDYAALDLIAARRENMAAVLIVEDEHALSDLLRQVLEEEGYTVVTAASLGEAEALLLAESVDLILADLVESSEHGDLGTVQVLLSLAGERPLLLCTGQPDAERLADETGLAGVVAKPFDLDVLLHSVQSALSSARPGSAHA
jgi:DNA-binding NtrC family response regulator